MSDFDVAIRRRPNLRGETPLPRLALERTRQMLGLYENWPRALHDRLGFSRGRRHVVYRLRSQPDGLQLVARANGCDVRTITEIWVGEFYDRFFTLDPLDNRSPVVIDIGANCGYFAVYMASRYPYVQLVCYEPEAKNRALAQANLALNGVEATVRPEAVVAEDRPSILLNLSEDPRLHTTVHSSDARRHGIDPGRFSGRVVEVPAVHMNQVLASVPWPGRVDLLKIDVEGIDLDLVGAIDDRRLPSIDCIVVETEGQDTGPVVGKLEGAGFVTAEDAGLLFAHR